MPRGRQSAPTPNNVSHAPCLLESEQAVLGAAIRSPELAELALAELAASDFYSARSQAILGAIRDLSDGHLTVNPVSVGERSGVSVGDISDLVSASAGIGQGELKTLIADLRRIGQLRIVYNAAVNCASSLTKTSRLEDVMSLLEAGLYGLDRTGQDEAKEGSKVILDVAKDFLERQANGGGVVVSTGISELDKALVGLRPGKLVVVAGRPSMGKTALASTLRRNVLQQGLGVIEFSLEMDAEELCERELSYQAQLNLRKVLTAKDVTPEELVRVQQVTNLYPGRWFIDDRTYSIAGIRRKSLLQASRMQRNGIKTGLVVVDYIQLAGDSGDGREQSISAVSRGCKFLSKQLGCTVLALSQLNRSCEFRDDRRPIMSDLRESGAIEQDADVVGFVYREHMYDNSFPPEQAEFIIRKQRSGPTGTVHLHYSPKTCTFSDPKMVAPAAPVQATSS